MTTDFTDIAISYAKAGIKVFPCEPTSKKPLVRNGFKNATSDPKEVARLWKKHPDALIAGVCDGQFTVVDVDLDKGPQAFASLGKIHQFTSKTNTFVTTKSNGQHYYFKYEPDVNRKIGIIPAVDILGNGGYVILPDGDRYKQNGSLSDFIGSLRSLPPVDKLFKNHITGETEIKDFTEYRESVAPVKRKSEPKSKKSPLAEAVRDEVADAIEAQEKASINRVYDPIGRNAGYEDVEFNGDPIHIKAGSLDSKRFNSIYFNKDVQKRIATHLGVILPKNGEEYGKNFRSILPTHSDNNPSMGARWVKRKNGGYCLVIRDFADHQNDGKNDYNLTRVFMNIQYGRNYRVPSPTEFVVWSVKLMRDAGVIDFVTPSFSNKVKHLTKGQQKAAQGFLELVGVKSLWKGGNTETCYSQKFAAAWTGVSTETVNKMKASAFKFGLIEKTGKDHGEGPMRTPIFRLGAGAINRTEINTISELICAVNAEVARKKKDGGKRFLGSQKRVSTDTAIAVNDNTASEDSTKEITRFKDLLKRDRHENTQRRKEQRTSVSSISGLRDGHRVERQDDD